MLVLVLFAWLWRGEQCFEIPGRERGVFQAEGF